MLGRKQQRAPGQKAEDVNQELLPRVWSSRESTTPGHAPKAGRPTSRLERRKSEQGPDPTGRVTPGRRASQQTAGFPGGTDPKLWPAGVHAGTRACLLCSCSPSEVRGTGAQAMPQRGQPPGAEPGDVDLGVGRNYPTQGPRPPRSPLEGTPPTQETEKMLAAQSELSLRRTAQWTNVAVTFKICDRFL